MLSSEAGPDIYQELDNMESILENESLNVHKSDDVSQPSNGVYYFPTELTKLQTELQEFVVNIFNPKLLQDIYKKKQKTRIHSLLDSDDGNGSNDGREHELSPTDKIDYLYEQLTTITKNPSLLVDHFLPKRLLLLEINERLSRMSGKFELFNRILDSMIDDFYHGPQFDDHPTYNILVVAESIRELELIEGLIIGKELYYNNVSSLKLYDDTPKPKQKSKPKPKSKFKDKDEDSSSDDFEFRKSRSRRYSRKPSSSKSTPLVCLNLITSLQLYNNYTPLLDESNANFGSGGLQIKMIFSFDPNLDSKCPSIEMIRNQSQSTFYTREMIKIPIIIPVPIYSIEHMQVQIPPPNTTNVTSDISESSRHWKQQIVYSFLVNRINNHDNDSDNLNFYLDIYGKKMDKIIDWFHNWDTINFPIENQEFWGRFDDKLMINYKDEVLIEHLNQNYLPKVIGNDNDTIFDFNVDVLDYKSYKAKLSEVLYSRLNDINEAVINLSSNIIPDHKIKETERQARLDKDEDLIAENYRKLRRLNEDATISERRFARAEEDHSRSTENKQELINKVNHLTSLKESTSDKQELLSEQEKTIQELTNEDQNLTGEYDKLFQENENLRNQYQDSSSEALQLSHSIQKVNDIIAKKQRKLDGPAIKLLPTLIRKDEIMSNETQLKKLSAENEFLTQLSLRLNKVENERKAIMDHSSGTNRQAHRNNSRGSTPLG